MAASQPTGARSIAGAIRALIDVNVALIGCLLLGWLLLGAFWVLAAAVEPDRRVMDALPVRYRYSILLEAKGDRDVPPAEEVVRRAEASGRWASVRIEERDGQPWLHFLSNRWKPEMPGEVAEAGYRPGRVVMGPVLAIEKLTRSTDPWLFGSFFASQALAFIFAGGLLMRRLNSPPRDERFTTGRAIRFGLTAGAVAFAVVWLLETLQGWIWQPATEQPMIRILAETPGGLFVLVPVAVVLAPFGEELFFRGYVFRKLGAHTPPFFAYGYSALMFAGVHFNPAGLASYLLYGLVLAALVARTDRLLTAILAHGTVNALGLLLLALG